MQLPTESGAHSQIVPGPDDAVVEPDPDPSLAESPDDDAITLNPASTVPEPDDAVVEPDPDLSLTESGALRPLAFALFRACSSSLRWCSRAFRAALACWSPQKNPTVSASTKDST